MIPNPSRPARRMRPGATHPAPRRLRGALAGLLASALLLVVAAQLQAHGALRRAMPGAGDRVVAPSRLWMEFTEAVEVAGSLITLTDSAGAAVTLGAATHPGDSSHVLALPVTGPMHPGSYRVTWRVTGRDGHPVHGQYAFVVIANSAAAPGAVGPMSPSAPGVPPQLQSTADSATERDRDSAGVSGSARGANDAASRPSPSDSTPQPSENGFGAESGAYVALRWLSYVMLVAGIGAVVMARVTDRAATVGARHAIQTRIAGIGLAAAWLGVALSLARLLAQSWAIHGPDRAMSPTLIGPLVATSTWGHAWAVQLLGALLGAAGFTLAYSDVRRRGGWQLAQLAVLVAAAGTALGGHAAAGEGWRAPVLVATDFAHILGAGAWMGGVMMLGVAVLTRAAAPAAANVVRAFSPWALVGAAVLVVTGLIAAWAHLEAPLAPWRSYYGRVLLVKLALVAVIILLGALNWQRLGPASSTTPGNTTLRRSVWFEVVVALAVLAATAVLVAVDPSQP